MNQIRHQYDVVTVGGSVVLFYCSRVSRARSIAVRPDAIVLKDNDQDGSVQFVPPDGVPLRSVWVAVDETSGNYVVGSLPDFPVEETPISGDSFRRNVQNDIEALAEDIPTLVVLLVRPASGAWLENGFDGDASDGDGLLNGHVLMNFSSGITIDGTASAPHFLKNGDTVIAIDPGHLDVYTALVGR